LPKGCPALGLGKCVKTVSEATRGYPRGGGRGNSDLNLSFKAECPDGP